MTIARADWPLLLDLVEQAMDLPMSEREAWLDALDLTESQRNALRGLLENRRAIEADDFLGLLPAVASSEHFGAPGRLHAGLLIGPWRLLREIGQGGMSTVWLAERADDQVTRQVALKLPHAGPGQDLLARRMLRERNILAGLEHPNIARLYDVGLTDAGTPFLVMEYVNGENLLAHADHHRMTIPQRLALFQQVLHAVQYAHGKLVLHRDIKPSNILVNEAGAVKLLDFGIAKLMSGDGDTGTHSELTRGTERQLTPSYASPEQIQGQTLGTASDVYSLGVILYELLCGQRPHEIAGASAAQLEAAVLNEEIRPPSRRECNAAMLTALGTTAKPHAKILRGDLDAIALKALSKAPEHRYASAEAFGADLVCWLTCKTVSARNPGFLYPVVKFVRRNRISVGLGAVAALTVLAAGAVAVVQGRIAMQESERAAAARDFVLQLFEETDPAKLRGVELTASQRLELGRQQAEVRLDGQSRLQAELLIGIGEAQLRAGDTANAEASLFKAANSFMSIGDRPREAAARITRLHIAVGDSDVETVVSRMRDLEPMLRTIRGDPVLHVRWLAVRGAAALAMDDPTEARKWLEQCLALADLKDPQQIAAAFEARLTLSSLFASIDAPEPAREQLNAAEDIPEAARSLPPVERALALAEARAVIDWRFGDVPIVDAIPELVRRCDSELGARHLICVRLKIMLLMAYRTSGDTDKMAPLLVDGSWWMQRSASPIVQFRAALYLTQATALIPPIDPKAGPLLVLEYLLKPDAQRPLPVRVQIEGLITLAEIQLRMGDRSRASLLLDRAESVLGRAGREAANASRHVKLGRGLIMQSLGKDHEALTYMSDLCRHSSFRSARYHLMRLNCVRSLALTGQSVEAIKIASEANEVLSKTAGPEAPNTQRTRKMLEALQSSAGWRPPPWDASQIFLAF